MNARAPLLLLTLPLVALSVACGDGGGLPTGSWHPYTGTGGSTTGGGGSTSNGSTNGGSSSGGSASNGTSSGGSTSSGGPSSSGSSGASSSSSSGSSGASSSSGSSMPTPDLTVSVDKSTLQSQLMASSTVHVSVAPNGYIGMASLALGSMPSGVTGTFDNPTVALDGRTTATATLTLKTATSTPPGAVNIDVDATAMGANPGKATVALTVQSVITVHIPAGVNNMGGTISNPVTTAYGPYPMKITAPQGISDQNPVTVYFFNDDSVSHEIHASADQEGFAHDPGPIPPMSMDSLVRNVNTTGSYNYYLHDQGAPITVGLIEIQ